MKKFILETKSSLGLAPKTVDEEFDKKAASVKSVSDNVQAYSSASSKMTSAVNTLTSAMEAMAKTLEDMVKTEGTSDTFEKVASEYTDSVKKIKDDYAYAFKKAMSQESDLKKQIDEAKKLASDRAKKMAEYDTYRDAVSKKEEEYKKKNKDISESKHYSEEVKKRDEFKEEYEKLNTEYKTKADEIIAGNNKYVCKCMTDYLTAASALLTAMHTDLKKIHESGEKLKK